MRETSRLFLAAVLFAIVAPAALAAQGRDSIPGVELGLLYQQGGFQPPIAIKPFQGRLGGEALAQQVEAIVARDLRYSDRYRVMDSIPAAFVGEGINYDTWDRLGASWLLTGSVEGGGDGYVVVLELHDVVYKRLKDRGTFRIPAPTAADFRMAVHRTSDEIVRWSFGEPGMAASRITFSMLQNGVKELYLVDSDGENLTRLTNLSDVVLSPSWAPDGSKIAFNALDQANGTWQIYEYDLASRRTRRIPLPIERSHITPSYQPGGQSIAFSVVSDPTAGALTQRIATYNLARDCCQTFLTQPTRDDLSPTFSPDGQKVAFNSNRFGDGVPQIFVVPATGGTPELISPYGFDRRGQYFAPDWSPHNDLVAFHGRVDRTTNFQILVARMGERARLTQLTWEGNNEDPSWAPDGRHLVFAGERRNGKGLFVVDTVTGTVRPIRMGVEVRTPDWSPALAAPGGQEN